MKKILCILIILIMTMGFQFYKNDYNNEISKYKQVIKIIEESPEINRVVMKLLHQLDSSHYKKVIDKNGILKYSISNNTYLANNKDRFCKCDKQSKVKKKKALRDILELNNITPLIIFFSRIENCYLECSILYNEIYDIDDLESLNYGEIIKIRFCFNSKGFVEKFTVNNFSKN